MAKKSVKKSKNVKIVANGTLEVVLTFPRGISLKAKKQVPYADLAKILGEDETDMVEGQCRIQVRTPSAIGGVRG